MFALIPNLTAVLLVAALITVVCWELSMITHDYSWVDRSWSLSPVIYSWIYFAGSFEISRELNLRALVMTLLVTVWGLRLTFNFARKGGYSGIEDYRWATVRKGMGKVSWQLFNIFFICIYQNILLVLIAVPVGVAAGYPSPMNAGDWILAVLFLAATFGEWTADQQQWAFQNAKKARRDAGKGLLEPGFATTGLFKFSRHPNYFFEQAQWWLIWLMSGIAVVTAAGTQVSVVDGRTVRLTVVRAFPGLFNGFVSWTVLGPVLLTVLFIGSLVMTENISKSKYPKYVAYQKSTSAQIPWFPKQTKTRNK